MAKDTNTYINSTTGENKGSPLNSKMNKVSIDNSELTNIKLVDATTGQPIQIKSVIDSIRLSNSEGTEDHTVIFDHVIPDTLLNQFIIEHKEMFNTRSCIDALGLYCTEYMYNQVTKLGDQEQDLTKIDEADQDVRKHLEFTNYVKGGAMGRNPITGSYDESLMRDSSEGKYTRVSPNLGIGLGEATVLNPTFQFNKRDDPRTNPLYTKIGRVYSTKIMNNWPVIMFQPGRLKYNTGFLKMLGLGGGAGLTDALIRTGGEGIKGFFAKLLSPAVTAAQVVGTIGSGIFGSGKMVSFRQAIKLYNQYFSSLCAQLGQFMGLYHQDPKVGYSYCGEVSHLDIVHILPTLHMFGPQKYQYSQFIPFRIHKNMIGSETFSNSTTENPLASELNSAAEANSEESTSGDPVKKAKKFVLGIAGQFSDKAAIMAGNGRVSLPDVYSGSSFNRSITCSFEFHAPYGTAFCKFENTLIPLISILCMGLPRQTGKLSYTTPFALRVFVKNHIMINYGLIESISVTRGGDSNDWGPDGFPKTIKVDVSIKDMEVNIGLPLAAQGPIRMALEVMFPSTGMSEYLATIGGCSLDYMTHNYRKKHLDNAKGVLTSVWKSNTNMDNFLFSVTNTRVVSNVLQMFEMSNLDNLNKLGDMAGNDIITAQEQMAQPTTNISLKSQYALLNGKEGLAANKAGDMANAKDIATIASNLG